MQGLRRADMLSSLVTATINIEKRQLSYWIPYGSVYFE